MAKNVNKCIQVDILAITGSLAINTAGYQEMNCKSFYGGNMLRLGGEVAEFTVGSFGEIQLTMFEKYRKRRSDPEKRTEEEELEELLACSSS